MNQIGPSIIRTVVPLIVAGVVSQLVQRGIDPGPYQEIIAQVVGAVVAAAYYGAVRLLETYVKPRLGLLLGSAKTPTYSAPAKPAPESPTGYVATEDAPAPEGEPVTVEPIEHVVTPAVPTVETTYPSQKPSVQDLVYHALSRPADDLVITVPEDQLAAIDAADDEPSPGLRAMVEEVHGRSQPMADTKADAAYHGRHAE